MCASSRSVTPGFSESRKPRLPHHALSARLIINKMPALNLAHEALPSCQTHLWTYYLPDFPLNALLFPVDLLPNGHILFVVEALAQANYNGSSTTSGLSFQGQTLFLVQSIHQMFPNTPALAVQQHADLAIAVADSARCNLAYSQPQLCPCFLVATVGIRTSHHKENSAGVPLARPILAAQMIDQKTATRGLWNFF